MFSEQIELLGHIIDSLLLARVRENWFLGSTEHGGILPGRTGRSIADFCGFFTLLEKDRRLAA